MLTHIAIWFCVAKLSVAQLNGEFWWLNDKLAKYNHVQPPPPKFDDTSEFDNDDNARIVFREDNFKTNSVVKTYNNITVTIPSTERTKNYFVDIIKWPVGNVDIGNNKYEHLKAPTNRPESIDRFVFKFPDEDNFIWKNTFNGTPVHENFTENKAVLYYNKLLTNTSKEDKFSEYVCMFIKKSECYKRNGVVHQNRYAKKITINSQLICCVFPLSNRQEFASPKIYFPDSPLEIIKRRKRSNDENENLNQRNFLLQRKYNNPFRQTTTPTVGSIVTPDYEYNDPYWNIKSSKKQENSKKYYYDDSEEYSSEVPSPGLVGLYSDHDRRPWLSSNGKKGYSDNDYYADDDSPSFGYSSTIDPRIVTAKTKPIRKPIKLTTTSDEISYDAESQTISYHSNPDFNVLQNFKLLLLKNKSNLPKVQRRTTTEDSMMVVSKEESLVNEDVNYGDDDEYQVFEGCGKAVGFNKQNKQIGESVNGSHPWLALVVPTKKRNSIICYATLVHPKAAITAAHCVYGKSPGQMTLLAGIWDLSEITRSQSRVVTVRVHPKYEHRELDHDLAMLHWIRPLQQEVNLQPVCLGDPHLGDECMLFGWGGFDQAMRRKPRWQRASIHSCTGSLSLNTESILPSDAFCATVISRSTVTGMGGSLICNGNGRLFAVGVAVSRDTTLALLPIHKWVLSAVSLIGL